MHLRLTTVDQDVVLDHVVSAAVHEEAGARCSNEDVADDGQAAGCPVRVEGCREVW